jgi:hypothetical protein
MKVMIAKCGLDCAKCEAYLATQKNDQKKLQEIAENWSKQFGSAFTVESVMCDGCISLSNRLCGYCQICEIRKCAFKEQVVNCAYCKDYPCKTLNDFFGMAPLAKTNLEEIRKEL